MIDEVRRRIQWMPADLRLVVVATFVAAAFVGTSAGFQPTSTPFAVSVGELVITITTPATLGAISGILLMLLLPGYATVAAIFPNRHHQGLAAIGESPDEPSLTITERIALSFGLGVTLLALLGLLIALSPWGFSTGLSATLVVLTVVVGTAIAIQRGHGTVYDPGIPIRVHVSRLAGPSHSQRGRFLSLLLVASIVLALGSLGVAILIPNHDAAYTEFSVMKPDAAGDPVAAGYTMDGQSASSPHEYFLTIRNQEHASAAYTVIVREERLSAGPSATITESSEQRRIQVTVAAGDSRQIQATVTPDLDGGTRRIAFYLYRGSAPRDVGSDSAYRELYVWMSEQEASG